MQDLSVNELADIIRKKLLDEGIKLPKRTVRGLARQFFKRISILMKRDGYKNFVIWHGAITSIYNPYPESGGEETLEEVLKKRKLPHDAYMYMKRKQKEADETQESHTERPERTESKTVLPEGFWEDW